MPSEQKQLRPLVVGDHKFPSQEGAQQEDPAATLLFSLVIQPLLCKISNTCDLEITTFHAVRSAVVFWKSTNLLIF
jgi:hypothetical protein